MRIVQLIDSLEVGGAEKMAVNYANSLASKTGFAALVTTRKEGNLKAQLHEKVNYLFLNKQSAIDFKAVFKLRNFCKKYQITHLHAHSTSFFTAFLVKLALPSLQLIWHDHYGKSEFSAQRKATVLKFVSYFFSGIIAVNDKLQQWAKKELHCKNVVYLPNFTTLDAPAAPETTLKGTAGKQILCLANLRAQKNHLLLLEVAKKLKITQPDWTFHLVGKDFQDDYSAGIKNEIEANRLEHHVFLYGSRIDTAHIISQAEIAVLTSASEGLPVALLEYGLGKKALVTTAVGEIPSIVQNGINGLLAPNYDAEKFYGALVLLIADEVARTKMASNLYRTILENNSEAAIIGDYLNWLGSTNGN